MDAESYPKISCEKNNVGGFDYFISRSGEKVALSQVNKVALIRELKVFFVEANNFSIRLTDEMFGLTMEYPIATLIQEDNFKVHLVEGA
jgi:hypothetical protein